jgi:hypothetical protein
LTCSESATRGIEKKNGGGGQERGGIRSQASSPEHLDCVRHPCFSFLSFFPYKLFNVCSYGIVVPEHNQYGTEEAECGWCHSQPFFLLNPQCFSGVLMELAKSSVFKLIHAENSDSSL